MNSTSDLFESRVRRTIQWACDLSRRSKELATEGSHQVLLCLRMVSLLEHCGP